jgi:hypothetical protein
MQRALLLTLGTLLVFGATAAILVRLMPAPMKDSDYLVVGSVATLAGLLALFLVLISTSVKTRDVFFKKRRKRGGPQ